MVCLLLLVLVLTTMTGLLTYGAEGKGPFALHPASFASIAVASDEGHGGGDDHNDYEGSEYEQRNHSAQDDREGGHFWKVIHETLVGVLLFLAGVHVCGVIVSSYVHKENLIMAMVTGKKKAAAGSCIAGRPGQAKRNFTSGLVGGSGLKQS
jgi:cytochrome b